MAGQRGSVCGEWKWGWRGEPEGRGGCRWVGVGVGREGRKVADDWVGVWGLGGTRGGEKWGVSGGGR